MNVSVQQIMFMMQNCHFFFEYHLLMKWHIADLAAEGD